MTTELIVRGRDGRRYRVPNGATQEQVARFLLALKAPQSPAGVVSSAHGSESAQTPESVPEPKPAPPAASDEEMAATAPTAGSKDRPAAIPSGQKLSTAGPAGEQRPEPAPVGQTTGPVDIGELSRAAALRLSGAARRDPDLKRMTGLEVDLVIKAGDERVVARVFQRAPQAPTAPTAP